MLCSRSASLTSSTRMSSRQREQELAQVLGGALILRLRLDLRQLGDAVDQPGDVWPEQFLDLLGGGDRVLDRVVEDGGDDRLVVELQVGEDAGDLDRMAEIGVARGADLGAVRLHREDVGAVDQPLVGIGIVGPDLLDQLILSQHKGYVGVAPKHVASAKVARTDWGGASVRAGQSEAISPRRAPAGSLGAAALHLARSASAKARPLTAKLSRRPARFASDWQRTSGRLWSVLPCRSAGQIPDDVAGDELGFRDRCGGLAE